MLLSSTVYSAVYPFKKKLQCLMLVVCSVKLFMTKTSQMCWNGTRAPQIVVFQSHQTLTLPNVLGAIVGHFHFLCSFFKSQAEPLNSKWPSMKRKHPLPSNFLLSGVCLKCLRGTKKQAWKSKCAPRKCCNLNNRLAEVFCVERLQPGQALVWHGLIEADRG